MGHVFISYSHRDTGYAHGLADSLQRNGFEVWIDERLDYGSQWPHELQTRLDSSAHPFVTGSTLQRSKTILASAAPWMRRHNNREFSIRKSQEPVILTGSCLCSHFILQLFSYIFWFKEAVAVCFIAIGG